MYLILKEYLKFYGSITNFVGFRIPPVSYTHLCGKKNNQPLISMTELTMQ